MRFYPWVPRMNNIPPFVLGPRRYRVCVCTILLVHAGLLARMATLNAPVFDEKAHLPSGLSHWQLGTFDLYRVNQPLIRMIASAPLLPLDLKT